MVTRTVEHLNKQKARYLLLEAGEIFSLFDEDPRQEAVNLRDHIEHSVRRAEAALNDGEQKWMWPLRQKWPDHFDSFYADHLYFSFPES